MKLPRRQFLHLAASVVFFVSLLPVTGPSARSQTPTTIKIVVPVPPGGALDILARLLAEQIGRTQGRTILIEYRSGANTVIGTESVSRAVPDGSTLLANAACAKPGDLTLASIGPASTTRIAFEMLKRAANVNMTFVSYPGVAPAVNALLGEHVTSSFGNYRDVREQINAGKLRALASSTRTRIEALPDVPTLAESGYKDIEVDNWFGLFAPVKTPKEVVSQTTGWFTSALKSPEVQAKLVAQGYYPLELGGAEFATYLRKQYDDYGRAIREANIKAE